MPRLSAASTAGSQSLPCGRHLGRKLPQETLRLEVALVGELRYEEQPHGPSSMVCVQVAPLSSGLSSVLESVVIDISEFCGVGRPRAQAGNRCS